MKKLVFSLFLLIILSAMLYSQTTATITVNDVALFDVNTGTDPTFTVDDPAAAGELPVITSSGGPTYLQYTVIVATGATKKITASSDKAMRDGLKLDVWAGAPTGTGGVGTALAGGLSITPSYTPATAVDLLNNITSCATGSGTTQGPAIYYTLNFDAPTFADLETTVAGDVYTITYTLTDG